MLIIINLWTFIIGFILMGILKVILYIILYVIGFIMALFKCIFTATFTPVKKYPKNYQTIKMSDTEKQMRYIMSHKAVAPPRPSINKKKHPVVNKRKKQNYKNYILLNKKGEPYWI